MKLKTLIKRNRSHIALVIGNGINRYRPAKKTNSWLDLLAELAKRHLPDPLKAVPPGVALTEFYDVLDLKIPKSESRVSLQREFCELMESWKPYAHHQRIVDWARKAGAPILTTNFESTLAEAAGGELNRTRREGFTDFYPWESYYGHEGVLNPSRDFAIWHVNGMQKYHRSVRLGLTHYMGSVQRAREWIHQGNEGRLYSGKNAGQWRGASSWLHVIFNTPLLIFGLGLEENEVFLRWLLIERARYFKEFPHRRKGAWYVHNDELDAGRSFFFEGVGIEPIQAASYDEIYGPTTWA